MGKLLVDGSIQADGSKCWRTEYILPFRGLGWPLVA